MLHLEAVEFRRGVEYSTHMRRELSSVLGFPFDRAGSRRDDWREVGPWLCVSTLLLCLCAKLSHQDRLVVEVSVQVLGSVCRGRGELQDSLAPTPTAILEYSP